MTAPGKNAPQTKTTVEPEKTKAETLAEEDNTRDESAENKEYILLDTSYYRYDNATDRKSRAGKRYKKGQRIPLSAAEAETLLAGPRPSVRELTKEEQKKDD